MVINLISEKIELNSDFFNFTEEEEKLMRELGISKECASDVLYLRSRQRWSEELEKKLIDAHKNNEPVNILEFGSTKETQQALLDTALKSIAKMLS